MIEAGIMDGDYILVNQQQTARNGDIVVAMVDGFENEATVKTFYKEDGYIGFSLKTPHEPHNSKGREDPGKVKGVFRYL